MERIVETSNNYGITQELLVISILAKYGAVSVPLGNSERYDCILDLNRKSNFIRIQIKSLNILEDNDSIVIPMKNQNCKKHIDKIYTEDDVDYIAIAYNNQVYLFKPIYSSSLTVRINKPVQYNQHWLQDYSIEKVLNFEFTDWVTQKNEKRKNKEVTTNTCRICGSPITKNAELCTFCYNREKAQNSKRISKEDLKKEILLVKNGETSFLQLGKKYEVSDNTIRKWCKYYNLPYRINDLKKYSMEEIVKL